MPSNSQDILDPISRSKISFPDPDETSAVYFWQLEHNAEFITGIYPVLSA